MKTTKLFIGILLVTIATTGYGQIPGLKGQSVLETLKNRLFPNRNQEVTYMTADYKNETGRIENWMSDLHSWAVDVISKDAYEAPAITRTIISERAEVVFESDIEVENWMSTPFESGLPEEEVVIEGWMTAPFEAGVPEEEIDVESWMTAPFEPAQLEEEVVIEGWMTAPFEPAQLEEEIAIEGWMTVPWN